MVVVVLVSVAFEQAILVSIIVTFSAATNKTLWPRQLRKKIFDLGLAHSSRG